MAENRPNYLEDQAIKASHFDAVEKAASLLGVNPNDRSNPQLEALSFRLFIGNKIRSRDILGELGDTYYGILWSEFKRAIQNYGFQILSARRFAVYYDYDSDYPVQYPENLIAAHPDKLILHATSSIKRNENLNSGEVYGAINRNGIDPIEYMRHVHGLPAFGGSGRPIDDPVEITLDVRQGLFTSLRRIHEKFTFADWVGTRHFVDLRGYGRRFSQRTAADIDRDIEERQAIYRRFLATCPDWVRDFILGKEGKVEYQPLETKYDEEISALFNKLERSSYPRKGKEDLLDPRHIYRLKWNLANLLYIREHGVGSALPLDLENVNPQLPFFRYNPRNEAIVDDWLLMLKPL